MAALDAGEARTMFRLDNEQLAFRFTATVSHRAGESLERLTEPHRLRLWLAANDLDPGREPSALELTGGLALRESIYRLGAAVARGTAMASADLDVLNAAAAAGSPVPSLGQTGLRWGMSGADPLADVLAVVARDAVHTLGEHDPERIKTCEGSDCAGLFLDTSRGNNRRWCSMNTCGNRAKKDRMRAAV